MKNYKTLIKITAISVLLTPSFAVAQNLASTTPKQSACDKVTQKVEERTNKYNEQTRVHDERFVKLISTLTRVSTKLKAVGQDTTSLDSQIQSLSAKREKIITDKATFMTKMQETKTVACGSTPAKIKTAIAEAKTAQQLVVADVKDFQTLTKTVRSIIASIRAQITTNSATSTNR